MTLENVLETPGLRAEIDFKLQHSTDAEDASQVSLDASSLNLPKARSR